MIPDQEAVLIVQDVTKMFGTFTAVDHVSFTAHPGTIMGLLGPNGAGKTTLLSVIVGFFPPTSGTIQIDGHRMAPDAVEVKQTFGFVPDAQDVLNHLTGWEYLQFLRRIYRLTSAQWQKADEYISLLRMETKANHLLETYSHGQRKKIQLIGALLHQPSLLILDEPFSGLDPEMVALTKRLIRGLRDRDVAILLSTHDLLMAEDLCNEVLLINQGQIFASGAPDNLRTQYNVKTLEGVFLKALGLEEREAEVARVLADF